ncbi:Hypothetical predicted protein [Olea europaea subsp. europaea]|uniref:Uncharacterized protein n=1 Tax=Olea europaea subsp. europaea TaxID=158383 RepID=A0A8S0R3W6_OLEEU|nr:Hypothetical predicted protein [Olea europaea subsp. europaea]
MASISITIDDIYCFYSIDREVFSRLVLNLARDPSQSLLIMAMWLLLEEKKFPSIIKRISSLSNTMLHTLAGEASTCLRAIDGRLPPLFLGGDMPLTSSILDRNISSRIFYENRFTVISGMKNLLNKVCAIAFTDILQQVIPGSSTVIFNSPIRILGFPHPTFGDITVIRRTQDYAIPFGDEIWAWPENIEAPVNERTLFLTFSRGYPVTEDEITELFTSHYGDCVENVILVKSAASHSEHPLAARMVVRSLSTVDRILRMGSIAKYKINDKHVWARKYAPRAN